jgi:hypothetical protein
MSPYDDRLSGSEVATNAGRHPADAALSYALPLVLRTLRQAAEGQDPLAPGDRHCQVEAAFPRPPA